MRILISTEQMYPFTGGGGYISMFTLANELAKKHQVHAVYMGEPFKSKVITHPQKIKLFSGVWPKYYFLGKKWKKIIEKLTKQIKPDLIITHESVTPPTIKIANKYKIPTIAFIRSYMHICIDGFKHTTPEDCKKNCLLCKTKLKYKLQYPFFKLVKRQQIKALKKTNLILPVSNYVKNITKEIYNIESQVIRPFIDTKQYKVKTNKKYITLINPDKHKGLNIFLKIIKQLPNQKFLVVGKRIKKQQNAKNIGWTDNMKDIYKQTKILLVPSVWPDPCPRVTIEAMSSGIPCIGTNIGGFPEEVEDSGIIIKDINNINEWTSAIKKLNNKTYYNKLSKKAVKQAQKFDFKTQFKQFEKLMLKC